VTKPTFYAGRFAPSPTGDLHFGSFVAALASYLQAKQAGGHWLIRVEDIDQPREVAGSSKRILDDLARLGMKSQSPVLYQSSRLPAYRAAIDGLLKEDKAYWCACSRKDLPPSGVYPGTCRNGIPNGKTARAVRIRVNHEETGFDDLIQGRIEENLANTIGDFIIHRADGIPAYQLAVVTDDAHQGITEVVRGSDLLDSIIRQIHLQRCLGLPTPSYAHHPVATGTDGRKLGKRFRSDPVARLPAAVSLGLALQFLGQNPPGEMKLDELWAWAEQNWKIGLVPAVKAITFNAGQAD